MMQVTRGLVVVAGPSKVAELFQSFDAAITVLQSWHDIKIFSIHCRGFGSAAALQALLRDNGYVRYFENCFFPVDLPDIKRSEIVQMFFSVIAEKYESIIDVETNKKCYKVLYALASANVQGVVKRALDFGCGIGVAVASGIAEKCELIGYDASHRMRTLARQAGLRVLGQRRFESLRLGTFDAIIASYVLHFGLDRATYERLAALLRPGGVLVANVHKGFGLAGVRRHLLGLPDISRLAVKPSPFGPCVIATTKR